SALGCGVVVEDPRRSTASVRKGRAGIRTRGGCSYGPELGLALWSTALGAKGSGTRSHPGRVLLRGGVGFGFVVGAPPSVRKGWARIRTRGGCSYGSGLGLVLLVDTVSPNVLQALSGGLRHISLLML